MRANVILQHIFCGVDSRRSGQGKYYTPERPTSCFVGLFVNKNEAQLTKSNTNSWKRFKFNFFFSRLKNKRETTRALFPLELLQLFFFNTHPVKYVFRITTTKVKTFFLHAFHEGFHIIHTRDTSIFTFLGKILETVEFPYILKN